MKHITRSAWWRLARLSADITARGTGRARDDRGDVPGWVMITVMSAAIVAVLTGIATPALRDMLQSALSSVR